MRQFGRRTSALMLALPVFVLFQGSIVSAADDDQQFGGWTVSCTERLYCTATTEAAGSNNRSARFKIERSFQPNGTVFVTTGPSEPLELGLRVEIDVYGLPEAFGVSGEVTKIYAGNEMTFGSTARSDLVSALRTGARAGLSVFYGGDTGTLVYVAPLEGLTLALLEIDKRQGRLDRQDAIIGWGPGFVPRESLNERPENAPILPPTAPVEEAVPESPSEPEVAAAPNDVAPPTPDATATQNQDAPPQENPGDTAAVAPATTPTPTPTPSAPPATQTQSERLVYEVGDLHDDVRAFGANFLGCALDDAVPAFGANVVSLNSGHTLHIVACQSGDANIESYVMVEAAGEMTLAQFPPVGDPTSDMRLTITTPAWRADQGVLTAVQYDSPNYDCGTYEVFVYDTAEGDFRRTDFRQKSECDGVAASPETFPPASP